VTATAERLPDGRWRCRHSFGGRRCELDEKHHGPCTAGWAQWYKRPRPCGQGGKNNKCPECERIDALEVLRLDAGGELRPLQRAPKWLGCPTLRRNMVAWATGLRDGNRSLIGD